MKVKLIHACAGAVAFATILAFWSSTLIAELFLSNTAVMATKQAILYGMWLLVPSIALTGASGVVLARRRPGQFADRKKVRMRLIAANGLVILIPASLYLASKASQGQFDGAFYSVQVLEVLVGAAQLFLMGRSFREGLAFSRQGRPAASEKGYRA
ncbi:MAG: hypothetical protein WBP72_15895 [Rhodocyclaceae bacterium]